jgi:serine/threonine-protein kinase RsbT
LTPANEVHISIKSHLDIVTARQQGRELAQQVGFRGADLAVISTAISEVVRNIVEHAQEGEVVISAVNHGETRGVSVVARDRGPGIPDIALAMEDGFSSGSGLGVGLPGARRLMDEFDIISQPGKGTTVSMKKWRR